MNTPLLSPAERALLEETRKANSELAARLDVAGCPRITPANASAFEAARVRGAQAESAFLARLVETQRREVLRALAPPLLAVTDSDAVGYIVPLNDGVCLVFGGHVPVSRRRRLESQCRVNTQP